MTTTALDGNSTVRDLLFGEARSGPTTALGDSLRRNGTVRAHVPGPAGFNALVEHEVAAKTDDLLSTNLADVAIGGWKRYQALRQAARRTLDAPTTEEIVALAAHTIEWSQRPAVEVFIDGTSIATINIELKITFAISGVLTVVRQGWLTGVRTGTFTVKGSLAAQQTVLAERHRPFDLPGAIWLRHGVPLLTGDAAPGSAPLSMTP
jgi:hypothetical protein